MAGFGEKVKGFLVSPVSTFQEVKEEDLGSAVKYFIVLALVFSILWAIIFAAIGSTITSFMPTNMLPFGAAMGLVGAVVLFITLIVGLIVGLFIGGAILHIFVYIVGGRKGYAQTVKAIAYGETPALLLGWIPLIGPVFSIWALILGILGIRELHEISTGRAVLAVLLPAIIIGITVAIAATLYVFSAGMLSTP